MAKKTARTGKKREQKGRAVSRDPKGATRVSQKSLVGIRDRTRKFDQWLDRLTRKQQFALLGAITKLEERIITLVDDLDRDKGRLVSTRANLKQAQALHAQVGALVEELYGGALSRFVRKDMDRIVKRVAGYLGGLTGDPVDFVGVDRIYIRQLAKLNLAQFEALGQQAVNAVGRAMYEHLMGGSEFNSLKRTIRGVFTGHVDIRGRPMATYSRQFAFDNVRNFQNQVTMYKADAIGLTSFIYYGDIIETSRTWCIRHAGKVYTEDEINKLSKNTWEGKSGPWRTHRGGYNCRHFWVPVRPEWVEGRETEVQNYFAEQ